MPSPAGSPRRPPHGPLRRVRALGAFALRHAGDRWAARRAPGRSLPDRGPERLRDLLEEMGGAFIKLGQILALQPDVLPRAYCDALFDLMDHVAPFDDAGVEEVFAGDLGRSPDEVFESFERRPLAAASIGQVHVARTPAGKVAVKVQRPTAERDFGRDIRWMRRTVAAIRLLRLRRLEWLELTLGDFIRWTSEELDYRSEARYMHEIGERSRQRPGARVPAVDWGLTTRRILTAEYLDGVPLVEYLRSLDHSDPGLGSRLDALRFEPAKFADNLVENFLTDVLEHGVFHADLHPANLLILPDNAVGYVDFGISGVISSYSRRHVVAMIVALIHSDGETLFQHLLAVSDVREESDVEGLRDAIRRNADRWFARGERTLSYAAIMLEMLHLERRTRLYAHPETIRYLRSVITLDGLIARFAPEFDVDAALDRVCTRLTETQAMRRTFAAERIVESWAASGRLLRDGAVRLDRLLDRVEAGELVDRGGRPRARRAAGEAWGTAALQQAIFVALLALLLLLYPAPPRLGLNLFTAEILLAGGGLLSLMRTVTRWLGEGGGPP